MSDAVREAAQSLFDNRLGWSDGRNPYAPPEFWDALGAALAVREATPSDPVRDSRDARLWRAVLGFYLDNCRFPRYPEIGLRDDPCQLEAHIDALAQPEPAKPSENAELRRMLCVAKAGHLAYMDDGEAQDNTRQPFIDFKRDSLDEITHKLIARGLAEPAKPEVPAEQLLALLEAGGFITSGKLEQARAILLAAASKEQAK